MEYYILINGGKQGPFSLEEVYTKKISPNTMIWKTGMADWTMAKNLPELADLLASLPPEPPKTDMGSDYPMPKTWLVESILVTFFCCMPLGIAGIVYAILVCVNHNQKNYAAAEEYSRNAGKWTKIGFYIGLGLYGVYLIYILFCILVGTSLAGLSMFGAFC